MPTYQEIINKKKREWKCSHLMDGASAERGDKLPFSSPFLNYSTYGGIPRNQITEFFGDPGGGKSTTSVDICKNAYHIFMKEYEDECQDLRDKIAKGNKAAEDEFEQLQEQGPKKVLYIDLEHSFDGKWARTLGIVPGQVDIMQPPDTPAESILQTILELIESGQVGLIVLDSIPSLITKQELDKELGERTVASLAGLLTVFCRKVIPLLSRYGCTLLVINQTRDNMDNPYVINTPGGKALKFYCSLRILFKIKCPIDLLGAELPSNAEQPHGYIVVAKLVKQKSAPWDRRNGAYRLMIKSGIQVDMDYADLATKRYGIIPKSGNWYTIVDPDTGEVLSANGRDVKVCGMSGLIDYFNSNPEYYGRLKKHLVELLERDGIGEE